MKHLVFLFALLVGAQAVADQYVKGHVRKDGTYVAPYMRSEPNQNRYDNYSTQGRYNPYTGQSGTQRNEFSDQPQWNKSYGNGSGEQLNRTFGND